MGMASAYAVGIVIRTSIETGIACFGFGIGWAGLTVPVIRWLGRRVR